MTPKAILGKFLERRGARRQCTTFLIFGRLEGNDAPALPSSFPESQDVPASIFATMNLDKYHHTSGL